jgi:hypothetical protein
MTWELILAAALLGHAGVAAFVMQRQARGVIGWRLPYLHALAGQIGITAAGAGAAGLFVLAATDAGLGESLGLYLLALFVLALAWAVGLDWLTTRLAQRSKGSFISPASMRRVSTYTLGNLLVGYGVLAVLGFMAAQALHKQEATSTAQAAAGNAKVAPDAKAAPRPEPPPTAAGTQGGAGDAPSPPAPPNSIASSASQAAQAATSGASVAAAVATPAAPPGKTAQPVAIPVAANGPATAGATVAASPGQERAVLDAVDAWAAAWSRRDVNAYLAAYSRDFRPADGLSRPQWESVRRQRIVDAISIQVKVAAPAAVFSDANNVAVRFRQDYQSNFNASVDTKLLKLRREGGQWRIVSELSGQ